MKKSILIILVLVIPGLAFGGFTVCHDGSDIVRPSDPNAVCVYYSDSTSGGITVYNRVKAVMRAVPAKYLKWDSEPVEMSGPEKDAVDVAAAIVHTNSVRGRAKERIDSNFGARQVYTRALVQILINEINILRSQHSLPNRTLSQLKSAIDARIDAGLAD